MRLLLDSALFWTAATVAVIAQAALVWAVRPQTAAPRRGIGDFIWSVLPAAGLAVVLALTWHAVRGAS